MLLQYNCSLEAESVCLSVSQLIDAVDVDRVDHF